jgi:hypothetical protein
MPTYPTIAAPNANNWTDHFPGSTLDTTKWGTMTSGAGAVTVTLTGRKIATAAVEADSLLLADWDVVAGPMSRSAFESKYL